MKKLNQLPDWEKNPRKITPSKQRILAKTLNEFGDLSGIVFNTANQKLVGGHQRKQILQNAEIEIVKVLPELNKQGTKAYGFAHLDGEVYAYREVFWDETTHAAAAIAANKGGGDWDLTPLKSLMTDLDNGANDMEMTGWELTDLENLMANDSGKKEEKKSGPVEIECPHCGEVFEK